MEFLENILEKKINSFGVFNVKHITKYLTVTFFDKPVYIPIHSDPTIFPQTSLDKHGNIVNLITLNTLCHDCDKRIAASSWFHHLYSKQHLQNIKYYVTYTLKNSPCIIRSDIEKKKTN